MEAAFTLDTSGAEWRAVVGYEGLYEVSSQGEVRSLPRTVNGRPGTLRMIQGVTLRAKVLKGTDYRYVNLYSDGKQVAVGVHCIVAQAFIPNPDDKPEVNHLDNDPANNRADNLVWATTMENAAHKCAQVRGRGHVTAPEIAEIRAAWPTLKAGQKEAFAARYKITGKHLWRIGTGRAHAHVPEVSPFASGYMAAIRADLPREAASAPFSPEALAMILADCEAFEKVGRYDPGHQARRAGRDFWKARNGGQGFMWSDYGRRLQARAAAFPPLTPYLGDDGKVHLKIAGPDQ